MIDLLALIAPEVIANLIELLEQFIQRTAEQKTDIKQQLSCLKIDVGILKDICTIINKKNLRNLDGILAWAEEASRLVEDTRKLLERIKDENNRCQKQWMLNKTKKIGRSGSINRIRDLRSRYDDLCKHNNTVLAINNAPENNFGLLVLGFVLGAMLGLVMHGQFAREVKGIDRNRKGARSRSAYNKKDW